jgi:hypothetical protein
VSIRYVHPITGKPAQPVLESSSSFWEDAATEGIGM